MPKNLTTHNLYKNLIIDITAALSSGLFAAQKALEYQRLKTYWEIGKMILKAVRLSKGELVLGPELYSAVSDDIREQTGLDLTPETVCRAIQFNRNYPRLPKHTILTFTHYRVLLRVHDPRLRLRLEKQAIEADMSIDQIQDAVADINKSKAALKKHAKTLNVERGEPYVYNVRLGSDIFGKKTLRIDCGFKTNVALSGHVLAKKISTDLTYNRVVRVFKKNDGYHAALFRKGYPKLYTYLAKVMRVVDGDTLDVRVDVGFGIGLDDRLRLRGINAPEIRTIGGRRAKRFLEEHLSKCPVVIIRTSKEGMYGRWLADIFTLPRCKDPYKIAAEGKYLNQLLLDLGLAELY